jgi:twitching motility protein PilT
MARLDTFIAQLVSREGDALLLEGGNNIFLVKEGAMEPLVDPRRGVLQNEHIQALLKDIAAPQQQGALDAMTPTSFTYLGPQANVIVKTALREGRLMARIKISEMVSAEGPAQLPTAPPPPPSFGRASFAPPSFDAPPATPAPTPPPAPTRRGPATDAALSVIPVSAPMSSPVSSPVSSMESGDEINLLQTGKPQAEVWFEVFLRSRASDLHLTSASPAVLRIDGDIKPEPLIPTMNARELEAHLKAIMPPRNRAEFDETNDTDFAYEMPGARLRCNVFRDRRGAGAVFRRIPSKILTAKDLNLPPAVTELGRLKKGLVLVTGPTGSGKSTTLSALVDWVNTNRSDHIITIEDPIEFVHEPKRCLIHQRQVGDHTQSFSRALRAALREDPDIVLVGEMRDLETVAIAIETAETGHLVFGTLHTTTAAGTVDRIIDQFAPDRQDQIRMMLSESLKGVVSQTLCKKKGGGRIAALEILLSTPAVSNAIREKKTHQIPSMIQTSRGIGMRTLNDALIELVKSGQVAPEEAVDKSPDRATTLKDLRALGMTVNTPEL